MKVNMTPLTTITVGLGLLLLVLPEPGRPIENPATQTPDQGNVLTVRNQFDIVVTYRTAGGQTRRVRVARRQWSLTGHSTLPRSPEPGLLVLQLTGGDATVTLGKERRTPPSDEFWTVPAGTPFRIEVGREQATFEVLAVNEQ
jgi:hypothetical protein